MNKKISNFISLDCTAPFSIGVKTNTDADGAATEATGKEKWYFVTIIVLTYCEKKLF